jgi:hypothetical protein
VLGRLYHLRADSKAACKDWVITLNRIKEAHLQQGNVKLVSSGYSKKNIHHHHAPPVDLLDTPSDVDFGAPRVVVVSNRQRTRAVAESQDFDQLIHLKDNGGAGGGEHEDPAAITTSHHLSTAYGGAEKRLSTVGAVVLTRWTKRKSSLSHLGSKLRTWARSLRHLNCVHHNSAVDGLDKHVHPPGHDYRSSTTAAARRPHTPGNIDNRDSDMVTGGGGDDGGGVSGAWIADETESNDGDEALAAEPPGSSSITGHDERSRPRRMSSASEDIRVLS